MCILLLIIYLLINFYTNAICKMYIKLSFIKKIKSYCKMVDKIYILMLYVIFY